jgi:hypothetical protein
VLAEKAQAVFEGIVAEHDGEVGIPRRSAA